ncbi:ferrochelatase-2, chloroplastic isoform X2 [Diospyros lotus]|uniref:ferrochelatase-2, chloroplastic isoform X2 n=1 Tax=Diospyros lotus TaxID=55363 RepID=UPI002255F6D4|nr:ferrochelatase-2, chloroplastic isoform X2 [Diospyros lotus]
MNCKAAHFPSPALTMRHHPHPHPLFSSSTAAFRPLLLPWTMSASRRIYCCYGLQTDACAVSNLPKTPLINKTSTGWRGTQSLSLKQPINNYSMPLGALLTSKTQDVCTMPLTGDEKIGVLLLNLGGPETLDDVQPFLFNLFADPDIIRLPRVFTFLQKPLAQLISVLRAPKSKEGYASIGGGSPLRQITDAQAEELRKALCAKNVPAKVYVGMRYWHPFTEEAIEQIKRDGIAKLVVLPLYPQFSISTSGSSLRLLESIFREDEYLVNMQHTVIPSWYQREGYIKAMADLIEKELGTFDFPDEVMIFFSAHGVPLAYVEEAGDPYKAEMEECVDLIMEELEKRRITNPYTLAYQSLVPLGSVEELLAAYDSQRRELPPPVTVWEWGWTRSAETWNGRAAMLAVLVLLVLEVTTGEGFLHQWGILPLLH